MPIGVIRYQPRPGRASENQALIEAVFGELATAVPNGLRYAAIRLDDGTFVHIVDDPNDSLPKLAAFQRFQHEIGDRIEPPTISEATLVGVFGFADPR